MATLSMLGSCSHRPGLGEPMLVTWRFLVGE